MRPATIRLRIRDLALAVLFLSVFGVLVTLTYLIAAVAGAVAGVLFLASAIAFRWWYLTRVPEARQWRLFLLVTAVFSIAV